MAYTPNQIVDYIIDNGFEADFLANMQLHKGNFSIGEIADKRLVLKDGRCYFRSKSYSINTEVLDEDIIVAVHNELYVSAFISRKDEKYNVHFLVHQYPVSMKEQFENEITMDVVKYMVMATVLALRLDTEKKVMDYIGKTNS